MALFIKLMLLLGVITICKASVVVTRETSRNAEILEAKKAGNGSAPSAPAADAHGDKKTPPMESTTEKGPETHPAATGAKDAHSKREIPHKPTDDNGKFIGLYEEDCSETHMISPSKKSAKLEVEKELLSDSSTCHWNIIGTENCIPLLTCKKFHIDASHGDADDPCPGEYLEVTDGSLGYNRYCGNDGPNNVRPTKQLRELYVTLHLSNQSTIQKREIKCQVTCCDEHGKNGTKLPETSEPEVNEDCHCGRKPNANRIVGGEDAKKGEFPWMAALVTAPTRRPFCGATVISDRFVVTAAHCFKGPYVKSKNIHVLLNAHNLDLTSSSVTKGNGMQKMLRKPEEIKALDEKENTLRFTIAKYFIHPLYIRQTNDFDVALIELDRPIDFVHNKHVSPICLPAVDSFSEQIVGTNAVVAGWGLNSSEAAETMGVLQKLHVNVFENSECKTFFDQRFTKRMLCAGYREGGKDSCKGDSGGPLISEKSKQIWELLGIVSWGEGCAEKENPGVYVNTREVIQWIRYISNLESAVWCEG